MKILLEIHDKAKENFNKKATELLSLVKQLEIDRDNVKEEVDENTQPYISATLTEKEIIGEITIGYTDGFGVDRGKAFHINKNRYGIIDDDYTVFLNVVSNLYSIKQVGSILSIKFLKDNLFTWIKNSYINGVEVEYIDFLLSNADQVVQEHKIWLPIPFTRIGKDFSLGKISFVTITKSLIDDWFSLGEKMSSDPSNVQKLEEFKNRIRKDFQGYAAGVFSCIAESTRAVELAYENFTNSLNLLRVFSGANLVHEISNGAYEYGHKMIRMEKYFIKKGDIISYSEGIIDKSIHWNIQRHDVDWMAKYFKKLNILLCEDILNNYQEKLLESLIIYSKSCLRYDISDKILYILVALETMLLRNSSEPIQQNVGERLAFVIEKDPIKRKENVKILKDIYEVRSKFIHHGRSISENTELLRNFMNRAWIFFLTLIDYIDKYSTKEEFLDDIDILKYS